MEMIVVVAVGSAVAFGSASTVLSLNRAQFKNKTNNWLSELTSEVSARTRDERSWLPTKNSAANQAVFACLNSESDCAGAIGGGIVLHDIDGTRFSRVAAPTRPAQGLTRNGEICENFKRAAPGNNDCPYRYELSWKPLCAGNPCTNPTIVIRGELLYSPGPNSSPLNTTLFGFTTYRSLSTADLEVACLTLNGAFDSETGICKTPPMPSIGATCPAGQFPVGVKSDGSFNCKQYAGMNCPAGQYVSEIDAAGNYVCTSPCGEAAPSAGALLMSL